MSEQVIDKLEEEPCYMQDPHNQWWKCPSREFLRTPVANVWKAKGAVKTSITSEQETAIALLNIAPLAFGDTGDNGRADLPGVGIVVYWQGRGAYLLDIPAALLEETT